MYAGEHCAGTELMIGPLFVAAEIEDHRLYLWRYARRLSEISQTGVIWGVFFFREWGYSPKRNSTEQN